MLIISNFRQLIYIYTFIFNAGMFLALFVTLSLIKFTIIVILLLKTLLFKEINKVIKRNGYSFRNFENFRNRILLSMT